MVHYIGLSGRRGQAPSYTHVHGSFEAAVADLADRYGLAVYQLEQLSVTGNIQLDIEFHGDQSLMVLECDCGCVCRGVLSDRFLVRSQFPDPVLAPW